MQNFQHLIITFLNPFHFGLSSSVGSRGFFLRSLSFQKRMYANFCHSGMGGREGGVKIKGNCRVVDFGQRLDIDSVPKNKEGLPPSLFGSCDTICVASPTEEGKKERNPIHTSFLGGSPPLHRHTEHTPLSFFCNRNETLRGRGQGGAGGGESKDGVGRREEGVKITAAPRGGNNSQPPTPEDILSSPHPSFV